MYLYSSLLLNSNFEDFMENINKAKKFILLLVLLILVCSSLVFPNRPASTAFDPSAVDQSEIEAQIGVETTYFPLIHKTLRPSDWYQLAANPQRTGFVNIEIPTPWRFKWIWNGPLNSGDSGAASGHLRLPKGVQPVLGGGNLYVGHSDGRVRAISQDTGALSWTSQAFGGSVSNTAAYDLATNSVYAGAENGTFWRLDASSGQVLRSRNIGGAIRMAPLLVGNTVYIGSTNGNFYALNKSTLDQIWSYSAGAPLIGSTAYTSNHNGLVILLAEDKSVHAVQTSNGSRRWRITVNGDMDPLRNTVFADTYPVVSEQHDSVIVRSYLNWSKIWLPNGGAPATVAEIRTWLTQNPTYRSFFVINLDNGSIRYVAPVMLGGIGNGGDLEAPPPQAVVKQLSDGSEVAYLLWRTRVACIVSSCDGREDTTVGEMDLNTGNIRFVQSYKNQGNMRLPTDEQGALSMAGNTLLHSHWMLLGSLRVTNRSSSLGGTYGNPIQTVEVFPVLNTLSSSLGAGRSNHFSPSAMQTPCDMFGVDPGFYIYFTNVCVYDQYWTTSVRSAVVSNGTIYWKSVDGAIIAIESANR
jgi:hypothetical protein